MVIQANMSPQAIVEVWEETRPFFSENNIPLTNQSLETYIKSEELSPLLIELNEQIGSSSSTCTKGG